MLYHCGLLSERPERDATLQWVRRGGWDLQGTPPEIERERKIWLSMPGFPVRFHARTLGVSVEVVKRHVGRDYDEVRDEVAANWLSCTWEDAVKLSHMRPEGGHLPVLCQLAIIDEVKRGTRAIDVAGQFDVHPITVATLLSRGVRAGRTFLPAGFELIRY